MNIELTGRQFVMLRHPPYNDKDSGVLQQEASAIGDYEDSWDKQGSSFLWICGGNHRLNREEVSKLINHIRRWIDTGSLWVDQV